MTTQQLLTLVDTLYPSGELNTTKVAYMNLAQNSLSPFFGKILEDDSLKTIVGQDSYTLPTGIKDVSMIISLAIGNQAVPTGRYDYTQYYINKAEDNPAVAYGYFQIINSTGAKKLCIYPAPTVVNLPIIIRYRSNLTDLSSTSLTASPEFDERYHPLLAFYCCHMLCVQGPSPDAFQANMFMDKYDSLLDDLWRDTMEKDKRKNVKRRDNPQWHSGKSFGAGY